MTKNNLSCLLLLKNEEYWLPYVLTQTEGHFDSYVIYDVGSTDGTQKIIDWWRQRMEGKADIFIRYLPHVPPEVQGAFRNSMIAEGDRDTYLILDGDELYAQEDLPKLVESADKLRIENWCDSTKKYGVVSRVEVTPELKLRYKDRRTHHRLYTRDAWWTGTHPGERPVYKQNKDSEIHFPKITCWHMHNTLRSSYEGDVPKRLMRKQQKTYHPGDELKPFNLLDELPMLRTPIKDFPVNPALAKLQEKYNV